MANNLSKHAPIWLVNLTGILATLTATISPLISSMPGNVPQDVKDWITWIFAVLTSISGIGAMVSKSTTLPGTKLTLEIEDPGETDLVGGRPDDRKP